MDEMLESNEHALAVSRQVDDELKSITLFAGLLQSVFVGSGLLYCFWHPHWLLVVFILSGVYWLTQCLQAQFAVKNGWAHVSDNRLKIIERRIEGL